MVDERFKIKWIETPKSCKDCKHSNVHGKCKLKECVYPAFKGR